MNHTVKWGILGTAGIAGRRFMPAMHRSPSASTVAIASRDVSKAQEFASKYDIPIHYGSYAELLADPQVEAVYVPLPNHLHCEWTLKAARAGKHVLCEKPMATDAAEARLMAETARDCGVILMEGFMYRLNPRTIAIGQAIKDGLIGQVKNVVIQFSFLLGKRDSYSDDSRLIPGKGAGSLMDLGCYSINFARYAFGAEPVAVSAIQKVDEKSGGDMCTSAILDFGSGRTATINCSFETSYRNSITVAGDEAVLTADRFFTPLEEGKTAFTVRPSHGDARVFEFDGVNQFLLEIEHFSDCVLGNSTLLLDPSKDAVPNAMVIDAIRESARTGRLAHVQA